MKIALVKQDVYDDLYVCKTPLKPEDVYKSTLMRTGPLSLITDYKADFLIIKEQPKSECHSYMKSCRVSKELKNQLQNLPANKITAESFYFKKPLSENSHKDFALDPDSVDWNKYDVVISINVAVPTRIVKKYPTVLWCYMPGEANSETDYPKYGYDVLLTQNITGEVADSLGKVDFPYTFLTPDILERIAEKLFGKIKSKAKRTGIYAEINNTKERPVTTVPCLDFLKKLGYEIIVHDQSIIENLNRVYHSKYFVKLEGRKIRGNSVIVLALFALYIAFFHKRISFDKKAVIVVFVIFYSLIPLFIKVLKPVFSKLNNAIQINPKERLSLLISSCLVIWILMGLTIPSSLIFSAAEEFSFSAGNLYNPANYIVSTSSIIFGFTLFWPIVLYFLFNSKFKKVLSVLMPFLAISFCINTFIFPGNYGFLTKTFQLQNEANLTPNLTSLFQFVIPLIFISLILFFITKYKKSFIIYSVLFVSSIALIVSSFIQIKSVNNQYDKFEASHIQTVNNSKDIEPVIHLSKDGKNVVMLFLDSSIGSIFNWITLQFPELNDTFSGFTYYTNTL